MMINGKKYKFNLKKLLSNIKNLTIFIIVELSFAYMFIAMIEALIEKYN